MSAYAANLRYQTYKSFSDTGMLDWMSFTGDLRTARLWSSLGFTVSDAAAWREGYCKPLGDTPDGAAMWRDAGHTPETALREARRSYPSPMNTR